MFGVFTLRQVIKQTSVRPFERNLIINEARNDFIEISFWAVILFTDRWQEVSF